MKNSKLLKVLSLVSASVLSVGMLAGCASSKTASTGERKQPLDNVIVMGTNAEFEPFEYRDGLEITGFDVEVGKKIAEKLGKELVVEDMAFDALIMALNNDKVDFVAAGMTADDKRRTQVDFSESYFNSKQMIIVKSEDDTIATAEDLVGKKVGVQLGTTSDIFVSGTEGIAEVVQFQAGTQAIMDLKNGKIDAVVIDAEPAKKMTQGQSDLKLLDAPFVEEEYAIAVKKGNDDILAVINETLAEIKADGTYDEIYAKYFGAAE